jgi:hypothetical protein
VQADKKSFRSFEEMECWKACRDVRRERTDDRDRGRNFELRIADFKLGM